MKSSATTAPGALQFDTLFSDDAFDVERPGPAAGLTFIPPPAHDLEVPLAQIAARLPKAQGVANDLAGRGVLAGFDRAAHGIGHRCWQGDAQTFNLGHCYLRDPSMPRELGTCK